VLVGRLEIQKLHNRERQKYEQGEKRIGKLTNIIFSNRKKKEQRKRK
jgi:hypothetical protein